MKVRFILLLVFSFSMLSCASKPKEEIKSQRIVYGVIQQPSAEGGMYVLCADCRASTPKTPVSRPGPISFVPSFSPSSGQQVQEQAIKPLESARLPQQIEAKPLDNPEMPKSLVHVEKKSDAPQEETSVQTGSAISPVAPAVPLKSNNEDSPSTVDPNTNRVDGAGEKQQDYDNKVDAEIKETDSIAEPLKKEASANLLLRSGTDLPLKGNSVEEKKAIIYFNGNNVRPNRISTGTLDQISVNARQVEQVAVRARMAKVGSLHERIFLARARSVEVRQELINRGVSVKKLRAYYHADCCWIGDPANPGNNRVEVMLEPTKS